jgi:glycerol-3-phosphate dehydrogenase (NAD(P)+)
MGGRLAVGVVGGGAWGIALAAAAARAGTETFLYSRRARDPGMLSSALAQLGDGSPAGLPPGVRIAADLAELGGRSRLIVLAVPSAVARDVARSLGEHVDGSHFLVHGVRGLVEAQDGRPDGGRELLTISDLVREETPTRRVGALGGPALASDLFAGRPSVLVCGSRYPDVTLSLHEAFSHPLLRLFETRDLLGLEWASALVGCLAIGVGYARGLGLGPGLLAAIITRAVEEGARLAEVAGGEERTLLGLAGYGDLLASIAQTERPEVRVGEALARGRTLSQAVADAGQRVEAIELTERVVDWASARGVAAPVFTALARGVLSEKRASDALVRELMAGTSSPA